ncbi:MAG TPA: LuxR C-terminal-related transcriptional regulator, partial [Anaerolineales bacterium]
EGFEAEAGEYAGLAAHFAVLRSIVARYKNDFEAAIALAERALRLAPQDLSSQDNAQLQAIIFLALASAYDGAGDLEKAVAAYAQTIHWSHQGAIASGFGITIRQAGALRLLGRLRAADKACREALKYIQDQGMGRLPVTGILYIAMSEVCLERNDLEATEAYLTRGIELGKGSGRFDAVSNAAPTLARLRQARQDASGALAAIQEAESALSEPPSPLARAELLALKAKVLVRQGTVSEAARWSEEAVRLAGQDQGQTGGMVALAASRVMLAQGRAGEAVAELTQSLATAQARGCLGAATEIYILRSLALVSQGAVQKAEADLEHALALAEPEGYMRIFLDEGQPMRRLLAQWLARAGSGPLRDYAVRLLSAFDAEAQPVPGRHEKASPQGDLVEALSQRELEVLHLIASGRTNQEIAGQLFVAPGTVKAHTASIYRKLDVANRTEAVARARQLGILP